MRILKGIDYIVKKIDFFYSRDMLRYEDDEDYKTLTGGIASIGIIVAIVIGFASMILDTLNLTSITTSTQVIKNVTPPSSILQITPQSHFRFGAQIWGYNLSDTKRYLDIIFQVDYSTNGVIDKIDYIPLEACTKQYFADYPDVVNGFQKLRAGGWLCPPMNTTMNLLGKYSSQYYTYYTITVSACKNDTDPSRPCASPQQIQQFFEVNQNQLYFTFYFSNPQINAAEKQYKQYYLEDMSYVLFGSHMGSETFLYFSDYTVETDYSIWPYDHIMRDQGCIVQEQAINHPFQTNIDGIYVTFNLAKSPNSIVYKREVQKLSSVFSFIGGMIGAVSAVLFVLKLYTNLAFEFSISFQIFRHERKKPAQSKDVLLDKSQPQQQISMNLWNFITYTIFRFSKFINRPCNWPVMKYASQCKEEISKQLDVKLLLKRIIFIQHCLTHLIEDYQLDALQMNKPLLPSEIKAIRQKCESILRDDDQQQGLTEQSGKKQKQQLSQMENCLRIEANISSPINLADPSNNISYKKKQLYNHEHENKIGLQIVCEGNSISSNSSPIIDIQSLKQQDGIPIYMLERMGKNDLKITGIKTRDSKSKRRSSYLLQLQKSAFRGNRVSKRIWNQVDEAVKKRFEIQIQQES